jgi:hypothetical protein
MMVARSKPFIQQLIFFSIIIQNVFGHEMGELKNIVYNWVIEKFQSPNSSAKNFLVTFQKILLVVA